MAGKTCSDRESDFICGKGTVRGILKIMFIFFEALGVGSYGALEVGMCI